MSEIHAILQFFDVERLILRNDPAEDGLVREWSPDKKECRIVHTILTPADIIVAIEEEKASALRHSYSLEWKTYSHDSYADLPKLLSAAGFAAGNIEDVLFLALSPIAIQAFPLQDFAIQIIQDEQGLADYIDISRDIGRKNLNEEYKLLLDILENDPTTMQIHIAYRENEPVSGGRLYLHSGGKFAELAGGRTKIHCQNQGFFTAVVGSRLLAAMAQNRTYAVVDALPTSGPILAKRGFQKLTRTQAFTFP